MLASNGSKHTFKSDQTACSHPPTSEKVVSGFCTENRAVLVFLAPTWDCNGSAVLLFAVLLWDEEEEEASEPLQLT